MSNPFIKKSLQLHKKYQGVIEIKLKTPLKKRGDLNIVYTPGVGGVSQAIAQNNTLAYSHTFKGNTIAIISDGSAVLGLGNLGPHAAIPVMEGKAAIFKEFAGVDAIPIVLKTKNPEEIIFVVQAIAPTFGAIQLEDIAAPNCFYIEEELEKTIPIPVMHDDQHGTAVVVLAALINAIGLVKKTKEKSRVVVSGAGAAGIAVTKILLAYGFQFITLVDSKGVVSSLRSDLHESKKSIAHLLTPIGKTLTDAIKESDVFIGLSTPGIVTTAMVRSMKKDAIVFAMANPIPEIMPRLAKEGGARVVATGRSDFPNQINNALVFPGIFRGLLDYRIKKLTLEMKLRAAQALASLVKHPTEEKIIPDLFDKRVVLAVKKAMRA